MLASSSEIKEPAGYGRFFYGINIQPNSSRWLAIAITLLLHLFMLWVGVHSSRSSLSDTSITPQLQYIELPASTKPVPARDMVPPVILSDAIKIKPLQDVLPQLPEIILPPEPLTPHELNLILGEYDSTSQSGTAEIAKNVFHPGLRKHLTIEANKPVLARVEDRELETYTDPSGATIVVSAGGSCLRSPPAKIGEPKNWYAVPCAGKTASEKIMDRVNEAVNGKPDVN